MDVLLSAILKRRAIKVFEPVAIPAEFREQILNAARLAPSSFNIQPYKLIWIESQELRKQAAHLCMSQLPAETASALVVAVADIGSWRATIESHLEWMRTVGFSSEKISEHEKKTIFAQLFFLQGWFGFLGAVKWLILRIVHFWKIIGTPPVARQGLFKWATKNTALACQNLMIAAEALGLNSCPMEGFDGRRLLKFLNLSPCHHDIVMVIAIGKKSVQHREQPQWRRPVESTVRFL